MEWRSETCQNAKNRTGFPSGFSANLIEFEFYDVDGSWRCGDRAAAWSRQARNRSTPRWRSKGSSSGSVGTAGAVSEPRLPSLLPNSIRARRRSSSKRSICNRLLSLSAPGFRRPARYSRNKYLRTSRRSSSSKPALIHSIQRRCQLKRNGEKR